jgi:S1-C subfamily serine protease
VQLSWLVSDSPASRAGLKVGDLVTAIDGQPVRDALDTFARARGTPGGSINVTYRRDGSERTVAVTLAK